LRSCFGPIKTLTPPSKKIIPIIIACLISLGAIFLVVYQKNRSESYVTPKNIDVVDQNLKTSASFDIDQSGLKKWEDLLQKTTANNSGNTTNTTIQTPTDKVAQDFMVKLLTLGQAGTTITPEIENSIVQESLAKAIATFNPQKYTSADLKISNTENTTAIKKYGNDTGAVFVNNALPNTENEMVIVGRALNTEDPKLLAKLDPILLNYHKILNELLAVSVPKSAENQHLDLVNSLSLMIETVEAMKTTFTDPITGLTALKNYPENLQNFGDTVSNLKTYFLEKGVVFSDTESGALFKNKI